MGPGGVCMNSYYMLTVCTFCPEHSQLHAHAHDSFDSKKLDYTKGASTKTGQILG